MYLYKVIQSATEPPIKMLVLNNIVVLKPQLFDNGNFALKRFIQKSMLQTDSLKLFVMKR